MIPIVSQVQLLGTKMEVLLYGPTDDGSYFYGIFANNVSLDCGDYDVGDADVDPSMSPVVKEESPAVYKITWGRGANPAYTIIDTKRKAVLEDSGPDGAKPRKIECERI